MLDRMKNNRGIVEIISIEERVPQEHLLRKIDSAIDFTHIYDLVEYLYCLDNGRPGVDPVVLFKIVLIQHLYGIASMRQTIREIDMNMAYRWFLGYSLNEEIPHFATVSYNFVNRFSSETVEEIFRWILSEVEHSGYLSPEMVFMDATHVKASANINKKIKRAIPIAARTYEEQLREEINADREAHGKKPFDDTKPKDGGETREATVSTTDPESGLFRKGEHKMCFAYGAHTVCDRNNFVLDVEVTPGNVHDSVVFDAVYGRLKHRFPQIEVVTADAAYKTPWICKQVFDDGRLPSLPYKSPMTKKDGHKWYEYVYDEYYDCVICPEYMVLDYATTGRDGYRIFKSKPNICKECPTRSKCTDSKYFQKTVAKHIWHEYVDRSEDVRHSPIGKESYALRCQTIERVFADAKEKHGMRYTQHRGLKRVTNWIKLKYAAMNLKKMALWKARSSCLFCFPLPRFAKHIFNPIFAS